MNPFFLTDGYKLNHHRMYPKGTTLVYSNFTPRSNKYTPVGADGKKIEKVVSFGQQYFVRWIKEQFDKYFFNFIVRATIEKNNTDFDKSEKLKELKSKVISEIKTEFETYLGTEYDTSHIEALWDLGYLPLEFKALPEGTLVPMGVPVLTVKNTHPDFAWLTNYMETVLSNILWKPMTSAAIALEYKKILVDYAKETDSDNLAIVEFQAHDFSMRGMSGVESTILSGMGHCLSFSGTDNIPVLPVLRKYYDAEGFIGGGVPATEHSVMCAGTKYDEVGTFRKLIKEFPKGILSVVSDTWDLWKVCTEYLPKLKEEILARDGKLVIRPDSGNPVDIICGSLYQNVINDRTPQQKGVIELLWDIFGGTVNDQGYKVLDPHIGAIYGDSITLERAEEICKRLEAKGFASTNIVLGIGSFTYQYNTRDTFGFAQKATYVEIEHDTSNSFTTEGREIFKDPITDDGTKKSAKGLLSVGKVPEGPTEGEYRLLQQCNWEEEQSGELQTIFKDGEFYNKTTLAEIKARLNEASK